MVVCEPPFCSSHVQKGGSTFFSGKLTGLKPTRQLRFRSMWTKKNVWICVAWTGMGWTIVYWTDPPWWGEGCRRLQEDGERGYTTNENSTHATKMISSLFVVLFLSPFRKKVREEQEEQEQPLHLLFLFLSYFAKKGEGRV